MVRAVQAQVGHQQGGQGAEAERAIDLDVVERRVVAVEADVGRHEFEPGLVGAAPARRVGGGVVGCGVDLPVLPAVVGEFVVVPDGDHGKARVQRLQARIAAVVAVQAAVVSQRGGVDGAIGALGAVGQAERRVRAFHGAGLEAGFHGFVDVVAQVHDEVQVLGQQFVEAGPVVHAPVLTGDEGELQLRHRGVLGGRGARAANGLALAPATKR